MGTINAEQKAKEISKYFYLEDGVNRLKVDISDSTQKSFIEGANWMKEELDKEIKLLNVEIDGTGSMLLTVQQDYIRCSKQNAAMLINNTNFQKEVAVLEAKVKGLENYIRIHY